MIRAPTLLFLLLLSAPATGKEAPDDAFPLLMRTRDHVLVRSRPRRGSPVSARIHTDAVLRLAPDRRGGGCRGRWMRREGGGFICSDRLEHTRDLSPRPAPVDLPDVREGTAGYRVLKGGTPLYERLDHIARRRPHIWLIRGSVLNVRRTFERHGSMLHVTRGGWLARAERTRRAPAAPRMLAHEVGEGMPFAMVVGRWASVHEGPSVESAVCGELSRWSILEAAAVKSGGDVDGWFELESGGWVHDIDLARLRHPPLPDGLEPGERWFAVDSGEQLFHVYEGERLLRVIPCSTGSRGNTDPGGYRIQWKRRLQTLQPRRGHLRVEDVQYVMYYQRERSIAIHAAYWHDDFGRPVSHGCVNLPPDDARWVYEYASPRSRPEDSENFPTLEDPGSRVIVFR